MRGHEQWEMLAFAVPCVPMDPDCRLEHSHGHRLHGKYSKVGEKPQLGERFDARKTTRNQRATVDEATEEATGKTMRSKETSTGALKETPRILCLQRS